MTPVKRSEAVDATGALDALREFLVAHRREIEEGRIEELRPQAAPLAADYRRLVACLERARVRLRRSCPDLELSTWMLALEPLFAPPREDWLRSVRAALL